MPGEAGGWMFYEGETTIHLSISYLLSNLDPRPSEWANHFWRVHPPASNSFLLYVLTVHIDTKPKGCSHWPLKHNSQGAVGRTGPSQQPGWMLHLRHGPADLPCSGSPPLLFWLETCSPQLCFIRLKQNSLSFTKDCVQFSCFLLSSWSVCHCPVLTGGSCHEAAASGPGDKITWSPLSLLCCTLFPWHNS